MRILFTVFLLFAQLGQILHAQHNPEWVPVFTRINQEVLNHSEAYSRLKEATSQIGHRLTGSANGKRAEDFAYMLFKKWGFTQVSYQPFEVESWSRGTLAVSVGKQQQLQPVKAVTLAHSPVSSFIELPLL